MYISSYVYQKFTCFYDSPDDNDHFKDSSTISQEFAKKSTNFYSKFDFLQMTLTGRIQSVDKVRKALFL